MRSANRPSCLCRDFLPRGTGLVTRCPIVVRFHRKDCDDHATFVHAGSKSFVTGEEIRSEIESETERRLGRSKTISKQPIGLDMYSRNGKGLLV